MTLLDHALSYLAQGFSLLPVGPDKHPLVAWKAYQTDRPTEGQLRKWWGRWPQANVGMATGPVSGRVVLDLDSDEGFAVLRERAFELPPTVVVQTGRGYHFHFADPGMVTRNFAGGKTAFPLPGIDFRGAGGYVILPPSVHASGAVYRWVSETPLAPCPDWLLQLVRVPDPGPVGVAIREGLRPPGPEVGFVGRVLADAVGRARVGTRNETGFWLSCQCRDNGVSQAEAEAVLAQFAQRVGGLGDHPYTEAEARQNVSSAYRSAPREPWATGPATSPHPHIRLVRNGPEGAPPPKEEEGESEAPEPTPEPLVFPEAAWRGPFAHYRAAMAGTQEASPVVHFARFWVEAAVRLGRRVSHYYGGLLYPNVYLNVFGQTGDGKTTGLRHGLAPSRFPPDVKLLTGGGSAEGLADWLGGDEDETDDEDAPVRVVRPPVTHLLYVEEFSSLLSHGRMEGSGLLPFLTEVFDCPESYEKRFRNAPIHLVHPTLSVLTSSTPEWFWKYARESDFHGGFGNRFVYLTGPPGPPIPRPLRPHAEPYRQAQAALLALAAVSSGELAMEADADALWSRFYEAWKAYEREADPLTKVAVTRIPTYCLKLAMVYAAFDGVPVLQVAHLEPAILVAHYAARCAESLMAQHDTSVVNVQALVEGRVLTVLTEALVPLPAYVIRRRIGGRFSAEQVARALKALLHMGEVFEAPVTKRGAATYQARPVDKR